MAIHDSVLEVRERIERACARAGRKSEGIQLMAVSKFHPVPELEEAWGNGIRLFGESRVREAEEKFPAFMERHPGAELHLIGSLQRNKAKKAAALFGCIQSVDREALILELGKLADSAEKPQRILLELHTGEESKAGFPAYDELLKGVELILQFPGLKIEGLMTMAPYTDDTALIRKSFRKLVKAQHDLERRFPLCSWECLSMGMTNDFEIAVEEGSTLLRIGTAIFGEPRV